MSDVYSICILNELLCFDFIDFNLIKDMPYYVTARSRERHKTCQVFKRTFLHVQSTVGAFEAEEVGVEHLLRDIKNAFGT